MTMSPETDILITAYPNDRLTMEHRRSFRHWQAHAVTAPLSLFGRRFRHAYYTPEAEAHPNWERIRKELEFQAFKHPKGKVLPISEYQEPSEDELIELEANDSLYRELRRRRHADSA